MPCELQRRQLHRQKQEKCRRNKRNDNKTKKIGSDTKIYYTLTISLKQQLQNPKLLNLRT
jgi:hypothetical protein